MGVLKGSLIFLTGAVTGAGVTWYLMKKKVNEANEAIQKAVDEVKESYSNAQKNEELKKDILKNLENTKDKTVEAMSEFNDSARQAMKSYNIFDQSEEFADMIKNFNHDDYQSRYISDISMEEFDSDDENTPLYLTYYEKDDMVVDSSDYTPMDDPEVFLGMDFREKFGEDDAIHIRNAREGYIYEVVIDRNETLGDVLEESADEG